MASRDVTTPDILGLGGAIVTVVGTFLPWVAAGVSAGPIDVSASAPGIDTTYGPLVLVLAIIAAVVVLGLGWDRTASMVVAVAGVLVVLFGVIQLLDLGGITSAGIGLYVSIVGGLGLLVAGGMSYQSNTDDSS